MNAEHVTSKSTIEQLHHGLSRTTLATLSLEVSGGRVFLAVFCFAWLSVDAFRSTARSRCRAFFAKIYQEFLLNAWICTWVLLYLKVFQQLLQPIGKYWQKSTRCMCPTNFQTLQQWNKRLATTIASKSWCLRALSHQNPKRYAAVSRRYQSPLTCVSRNQNCLHHVF